MQLLKRLRLQECHRRLQDPALALTPIKDLIAVHGYARPDQFARDFKQLFGVSPTQVRKLATRNRPSMTDEPGACPARDFDVALSPLSMATSARPRPPLS
jgi:hypothetical protein